ncbi:diguanylate cyclase [Stutzerimonas urumqiensis]|uniref:diguanylate cyclase domain-containing protein n=1 Tax=Stutzerimonas urumqiensis TaxID=638269 RepID=UPI003BAC328B
MSDSPTDALQRQLQALTDQFAERLRNELPSLARHADELAEARDITRLTPLMQALREQLHKLAGSAGTFGFPQLGEQARQLERQAELWLEALEPGQHSLSSFIGAVHRFAREGLVHTGDDQPLAPFNTQAAGRRVLLLDPDADAAGRTRQTLENFGYQVSLCEAIDQLPTCIERNRPDALIASLLDGVDELARIARLQDARPEPLPLMVVAADADFATQLAAVRAGAQGFFTRPLDITQLESRLERSLNRQQGEQYRVMIIDDDTDLMARYSLVLRSAQMQVEQLDDVTRLFETMQAFNPEVVLLDINMPGCSGPELAQMIRLHDDWLRVPIIYLSAETDVGRQMDALLKAGDDFITKPISDRALVSAVYSHAQRARTLSLALARDSLTGLLKHAGIKEQLALEVQRAHRSGRPASVVMLDIDHFKKVNDSHGHAAGDHVIRSLANLLRQRLRRIDSLGRYGGEEFMAVLPDCPASEAKKVFDQIRRHFADLVFSAGEQSFHVTLSAGICETDGTRPAGELLERADKALYAAKHGGRDQVRVAS